jgi:hypothetical protein
MPTGSGSPDCGPATGTDETTPNEPLYGIVRIGASRQTEHESHGKLRRAVIRGFIAPFSNVYSVIRVSRLRCATLFPCVIFGI